MSITSLCVFSIFLGMLFSMLERNILSRTKSLTSDPPEEWKTGGTASALGKNENVFFFQALIMMFALFCGGYVALIWPNAGSAQSAVFFVIYLLLGLGAVEDIAYREVEYCFSIPIVIIGLYRAVYQYGAVGVLVIIAVFVLLEAISLFPLCEGENVSGGIGGADIFIFSGLSGCFPVEYIGLLFLFPAIIALLLTFIERLSKDRVLTEDGGIALVPAILLGTFPVHIISAMRFF